MNYWKNIAILVCISLISLSVNSQIIIDDTQTVEWNVLNKIAGSGVSISNIRFNSQPIDEVNPQIGSFNSTNANVGLSSGVILSNGNINSIIGPNDEEHYFLPTTNPAPTDADLLALSSPEPAFDGAVLEFTFIPNGDTVEFDFVFASEEYPEFVGSVQNDVFGFFVAGPGIAGPYSSPNLPPFNFPNGSINVALIPGTTTPVSINNVNALNNSQYFVQNGDGNTAPYNTDEQYIQADGFTTPITVKFAVQCGEQYYIKFAIGDVSDSSVDSYVFIEEDSFSTITPTEVTIANGNADLLEGCGAITLDFTRTNDLNLPHSVNLTVTGTATNGLDYTNIPAQIDFPVGENTISLTIDALADAITNEGPETLNIHVENFGTTFCGVPIQSDINIVINDNISGLMSGGGIVCPGDNVAIQTNFTGSGPWDIEYTINGATVSETVSDNPYIIYSSFQEEYILTQVSMNGCAGLASGSATVSVPPVPTLDISGGSDFCEGSCADVTFTMFGTPPFTIYYTLNGDIQPVVVSNDLSFTLPICNNAIIEPYSIQSLGVSNCYGTMTGTASFTEMALPTLTTSSVVGICNGNQADIVLSAQSGSEWTIDYTYNGVPQTALSDVTDGFVFQTSDAGTYEFTQITIEDAPFCTNSISETSIVDVFTAPSATIPSFDSTLCIGGSIDIPVTFTGSAPWTFEYSINGDNQGSFMASMDTILHIDESGELIITSLSDSHCTGNSTGIIDISIASPINNSSTTFIDACHGSEITLSSNTIGGINEGYNYIWTQGGTTLSTSEDLIVNAILTDPNIPELVNYTLTVSQASCGIDYIFPYQVETHILPSTSFTDLDFSVCPGEAFEVGITSTGIGNVTLTYNLDGNTPSTINTEAGTQNISFDTDGTYSLMESQDDYCVNSSLNSTITLSYYTLPEATIVTDDTLICVGDVLHMPVQFTGTPPFTFDYVLDGNVVETINTTNNPYILDLSTPGAHSIGAINDAHCSSIGSGECIIEFVPSIELGIQENFTICQGEEIALAPSVLLGGDPNTYFYSWQHEDNIISTAPSLMYTPTNSGLVTLTVSDRCTVEDTLTNITVEEYPVILFTADQTDVCTNEPVYFVSNSIVNTENNIYEWGFGDDLTSTASNPSHGYNDAGDYFVSLSITTPHGCKSTDTINDMIHVNPSPVTNFTFNPEIGDMSDPEIEFTNLSEDAVTYNWYFGDSESVEIENPTHVFPIDQSGTYLTCLETSNSFGCTHELCKNVEIQPIFNVFIPNSFTPDGDGINELFGPVLYTSDIDTYEFRIYDRDGNLLFQSNDPSQKWNGSYHTNKSYYVTDGVYPWHLKIKLKHHSDVILNQGMITIIR